MATMLALMLFWWRAWPNQTLLAGSLDVRKRVGFLLSASTKLKLHQYNVREVGDVIT